jgi:hypothetical protein
MTPERAAEYLTLGQNARAVLRRTIDWIRDRSFEEGRTEDEKFLMLWQVALLTAAWDIGDSALQLASRDELRAARTLDRSLVEYGYRLHYYARKPEKAVEDGEQFGNYLRHIMRPTGSLQGNFSDKKFKEFRNFISSGSAEVTYPQIHRMMESTLKNLGVSKNGDLRREMRRLEAEYAISSGIAHGSQGLIADVFRLNEETRHHHFKSAQFDSLHMVVRVITNLILCLTAVEISYKQSKGADMLLRSLELMVHGEAEQSVTVHTENRMITLLIATLLGLEE